MTQRLRRCYVMLAYRRHADIVKHHGVNGHFTPPGKVLLDACQEGVREVEARDPEHSGGAMLNPFVQHVEALYEVCDIAAQRLHAWVRFGHPEGWHTPIIHGVPYLLQIC